MNQAAWDAHLENLQLRKRLQRSYSEANRQRHRAELWKARVLRRPKRRV